MIKSKQLVTEYRKQFGRTYQQMDCIHSKPHRADRMDKSWSLRYCTVRKTAYDQG